MQWRHLQPMRRKRALAAAATSILLQPLNKQEFSWSLEAEEDADRPLFQVNIIQTLASLLRQCADPGALQRGRRIHAQIAAAGHTGNAFLGVLLIQMYGKCGSVSDAKAVFEGFLRERNLIAWNSLITAYAQNGKPSEVLKLFKDLCERGVEPNMLTYVRALVACSGLRALAEGRSIHSKVISSGYDTQVGISTTLIDMYGKCGCCEDARRVFERMESRTVATWNAIISCYAHSGPVEEAMELHWRMNCEGVMADVFTFSIVAGTCCKLREGRQIHERAKAEGLGTHVVVGTALVRMYGRWGSLDLAMATFDEVRNKDIVCWTAMILVFVERGLFKQAVKAYRDVVAQQHLEPDSYTFSTVLCACQDLKLGREVHELVIRKKYETDVIVGTSLVNMYGRCRELVLAKQAFDKIQHKNVVSWNAMLSALAESGHDHEVVELFEKMDVQPDVLIFSKLLAACANVGDLIAGRKIHIRIESLGLESEMTLENGLVSMYSSCGSFESAKRMFDKSSKGDAVCWNAMVSAASRYSQVEMSLQLLRDMELVGVEANEITLTSVLHACAHAGLVEEAGEIFRWVNVTLVPEHFHCVIDLFGRLGMIEQAEELILNMPFEPDIVAWTTLVGACKVHLDDRCAARCLRRVSELESQISGPYVLLSNLCSRASED